MILIIEKRNSANYLEEVIKMNNEQTQTTNTAMVETNPSATDYINAINQLKATTVSRDEYDALVAERKELINSIINGEGGANANTEEAAPDYEKIKTDARNKLFGNPNGELNNLEYCKTALELREAVLKTEGIDIFVGSGHQFSPEQSDYDKAKRVADVIQECIDEAGGNSEVFTAQLMSRTNDVSLPKARPARR
jgi:hypothetical protein